MSALLPLSTLADGRAVEANSVWSRLVGSIGFEPSIKLFVVIFSILFSLRLISQFLTRTLSVYISKMFQANLSHEAFYNILTDRPLAEIQERNIGYFISLAGDETARAAQVIVMLVEVTGLLALTAIYLGSIFYLSPVTGIGLIAFFGVTALLLLGLVFKVRTLGENMIDQRHDVYSIFVDSLNGFRCVKIFGAEKYTSNRYQKLMKNYLVVQWKIETCNYLIRAVPALLAIVALVVCLYWLEGQGDGKAVLSGAFIVLVLLFCLRLFPTLGQILNIFLQLLSEIKAAANVLAIVEKHHTSPQRGGRQLDGPVESVELTGVHFAHNGDNPVLENFSARFERNNSYAIVGKSGSGKSTLSDLVLRLHVPGSGSIRVNDVAVDEYDPDALKSRLIAVGQKTTILNDTVANNIAFGGDYSKGQIKRALDVAMASEFVDQLPLKEDTILSYQGSNFSGGQLQRIGIARALVRNADVLILDESTSALDAPTQAKIISNIKAMYQDKILIFISHDASLVSQVDHQLHL